MATSRNQLKQWFQRGKKPLAAQFAAWIDSFWHKDDPIGISDVSNLEAALDNKANANHNHDGAYAAANHNHEGVYAEANHNHDGTYAAASHTHSVDDIDGLAELGNDGKADKVVGATNGNFAALDSNGNLTDSGKKTSDFAAASHNHDSAYAAANHNHDGVYAEANHNHSDKADKVAGATNGNFAALDSNGNLTDSGKKTSDFAAANHNHDSVYATANHNHDGAYAAANHNHNGVYAVANHNHGDKADVVTLAAVFDESSTFSVGSYVSYNARIYRCTTQHTGAWNAAHFTQVVLADDLVAQFDNAIGAIINGTYTNS